MKYFSEFPTVAYALQEQTSARVPTKFSRNVPNMTVKLLLDIVEREDVEFSPYRIVDSDRPDTLASQLYGSSRHAWIILLVNRMKDWYDWPLTEREFYDYVSMKYETSPNAKDGATEAQNIIVSYQWDIFVGAGDDSQNIRQTIILDGSLGGIDKATEGTVTASGGSTIVTGINTDFSNVAVGDYIFLGNPARKTSEYKEITAVTNTTSLVVNSVLTNDFVQSEYRILTNVPLSDPTISGQLTRISAFQKEYDLNDQKRDIRLIPPERIPALLEEFSRVISQ